MSVNTRALFDRIEALPADRIAEVEDFVDFIAMRAQDRVSTAAFARVWNNPDDEIYDSH